MDNAINGKKLKYDIDKKEHVVMAKDFCDNYFNKSHNKIHRNVFAITDDIPQQNRNKY